MSSTCSEGRLVLDVAGVGHELATPMSARFPDDGVAQVWARLVVRDDAHLLYGFPDEQSCDTFRLLLGVQRVGSAVALAILAQLSRTDPLEAVERGDVRALVSVKGFGRKIAEHILLDLKDKAALLLAETKNARGTLAPKAPGGDACAQNVEDAVLALLSIGYKEKDARKAVERVASGPAGETLELLIREALRGA
jgi:Holliday junction DNA helicase RuvA